MGLDVRLPTGDEMNLLGSGAPGLQPFGIWSATFSGSSPARQRGLSLERIERAGREPGDRRIGELSRSGVLRRRRGRQPQLAPDGGVRCPRPLSDRRRAAAAEDFHGLDGRSTFPNIVFESDSFNALSGAIGLKANVFGRLLLDVNLLFKLDENGLRDKVTPLIGLEYSF